MNNVRMLWGLVAALVLLLAVVTWSWYKEAQTLQTAAVVGDHAITEAEWVRTLKQKYGKQVLSDLVDRQVVFQEAKRLGITIDPKRIDEEIAKIKMSYGSEEDFQTSLAQQAGTSLEALRQEITYQLLLEDLATKDIAIDENDLLAYYNKNKEKYLKPMQARVWQIVVASLEEAKQVQRELKNGANFSTLAKERSIDSLTAANGGDMGWLQMTDSGVPDNLKETMTAIKLNEDSNPVPLPNNQYAIIRVIDRKDAYQPEFAEVKEQIRRELALAKVESLNDVLERLKQAVGVQLEAQTSN